ALDHRNIVRVLHADVMSDGRMFVAMELLSGPTLEQLLVDGPLAPMRALGLARQLVAGLAAAHAAGIIHGDVSTANIVVVDGSDPRLVLLDFGLSRLRAADAATAFGGKIGEHTSELQSRLHLVCRLLLEKKKQNGDQKNVLTYKKQKNLNHYIYCH